MYIRCLERCLVHNKCLVDSHHYGDGNDNDTHLWNREKQAFLQFMLYLLLLFLSLKKNYLGRKHNKSFHLFLFLKLNKKTMVFKTVLIPVNSAMLGILMFNVASKGNLPISLPNRYTSSLGS